jgi:protein phosphatase
VITRSLGYQEDVEVDVSVVKLDMAQQFLICSDGLSGHVDAPEMAEHMERYGPQECARRLIELACERGGEDNITTVIIQVEP